MEVKRKRVANVPNLRFPGFEGEWELRALNEISAKITDGTHDTPRAISNGIPYLTAIHIKDGKIDYENCYFISPEVHKQIYSRCNPRLGDLLIVNIGAGTATCALNTVSYEFSLKNVALVKPRKDIIDSCFLEQYQRNQSKKIFKQLTSGGAQPFLSLREIGKLKIRYPSLTEQQKIGSILSLLDKRMSTQSKIIEELNVLKTTIAKRIFSQGLRFKNEDGYSFPDWEDKTLGDIGEVKMCKRIFNEETSPIGEVPFFKIGSFGKEPNAFISKERYLDYRKRFSYPKKGDILISAAGTIGRTVIYKGEDAYYQDSNIVWVDNDNTRVTNGFLFYVLQIVKYNTEGGTIQRLYNNILKSTKFRCPTLPEQTKIARFLSFIDSKMAIENQLLQKLEEQKSFLLQNLFR